MTEFFRRYQESLSTHLQKGSGINSARRLGQEAVALKLETLDMVRIHQDALSELRPLNISSRNLKRLIKDAGIFFSNVILPLEQTHRGAREAGSRLKSLNQHLSQRTAQLAASNQELKEEIARREVMQQSLKKSEQHYGQLLKESSRLQEELRYLSRQILTTQEEERKKISRQLHDEIAASLSIINLELAGLKKKATSNKRDLQQKIANTQRLVESSVEIIHRFARELRPTTLDDLGLIPALHSLIKTLSKQARLRIRLTVFAGVERLDGGRRTVLFRVVQEALTNVIKHAKAHQADVHILRDGNSVRLKVHDDGRSFNVNRLFSKQNKRLGILGMRERIEMVGGKFSVQSAPGHGTTVLAEIPMRDYHRNGSIGQNNGKFKTQL